MFDFENALVSQIPLHEASRFFIGIKTAAPLNTAAVSKLKKLTPVSGVRSVSRAVPEVSNVPLALRPTQLMYHMPAPVSKISPPPNYVPKTMGSHGLELQSKLRSEAERAAAAKALPRPPNSILRPSVGANPQVITAGIQQRAREAGKVSLASARMRKSAAQRVIDDLLAGRMPDGKAGHYKTASEHKEVDLSGLKHVGRESIRAVGDLYEKNLEGLKTIATYAYTNKKKHGSVKLAYGAGAVAPQQDQPAQMAAPQAAPQPGEAGQSPNPGTPSMASSPQQPISMPTNYLGAELAAQQAQQQNEANFYRDRMMKAVQENQGLQQQISESQSSLEQLQQQVAMSGTQIQSATQQAVQAQDSALQQSVLAAKMRMGMQQMRAQMMQIASQDPSAIAEQDAQAAGAAAQGQGGPVPQATNTAGFAPPGMAPEAGSAAPGNVGSAGQPAPGDAGGGTPEGNATAAPAEPEAKPSKPAAAKPKHEISVKTSGAKKSVLRHAGEMTIRNAPWLAAGGAVGAGLQLRKRHHQEALKDRVKKLDGRHGTFGESLALSKAKARLEEAHATKEHPRGAAVYGAAKGAVGGLLAGQLARQIHSAVK